MPANERRFWKCKRGHIIGEIKRIRKGEGHVRALWVYEESVSEAPEEIPPLRAKVTGDADEIRCTVKDCGCTRDWHIGEDGIGQLMEARAKMNKTVV